MSLPISIVIFGASGDLTERKLIPALYSAFIKERLPQRFKIIGVSRSAFSDEDFREKLREKTEKFAPKLYKADLWKSFAEHIYYQSGHADRLDDFHALKDKLNDLEGDQPANRLYYLSTAPDLYEPTILNLGAADMVHEEEGWRHIVVEKPFGYDLESAQALNATIHSVLAEHQVYRIDHYLGKETAQNILFFRFANTIFEPIWNRNYIANVQISVTETVDVGRRAGYYDQSGVLRDMFQNHLLQLLMLVAMEPPVSFEAEALRDEKIKVLRSIPPIDLRKTVRAQYRDYLQAEGVAPNSPTPTYAALKLNVDNWRWQGVPFYLRSGKALASKTTEINIVFKCPPHQMFALPMDRSITANVLSMCIQPNEGISLRIESKLPDSLQETRSVHMSFDYQRSFGEEHLPDAYERLLLDAVKGDASLYSRSDSIETAWALIDPVISGWEAEAGPAMATYEQGTWGPVEADALIGADGFVWHHACGDPLI